MCLESRQDSPHTQRATSYIPDSTNILHYKGMTQPKKRIYYTSIYTGYIEPKKFIRFPALSDSPETATENTQ